MPVDDYNQGYGQMPIPNDQAPFEVAAKEAETHEQRVIRKRVRLANEKATEHRIKAGVVAKKKGK